MAHRCTRCDCLRRYAANFLSNLGNYKSFGDSKFVPGCSPAAFRSILEASAAFKGSERGTIVKLWNQVGNAIFSLEQTELQLGLETDGVSTYFSANITKADTELIKRFIEGRGLSPYNTRAFKLADGSFEIRFASASPDGAADGKYKAETVEFEGVRVSLVFGDHGALMQRVCDNLRKALEHAANDEQRAMLTDYIASFNGGSIDDHKVPIALGCSAQSVAYPLTHSLALSRAERLSPLDPRQRPQRGVIHRLHRVLP